MNFSAALHFFLYFQASEEERGAVKDTRRRKMVTWEPCDKPAVRPKNHMNGKRMRET